MQIGRGQVLAEGGEVAILASGTLVAQALLARSILAERHVTATVVNMHTLKPRDTPLIAHLAATHRLLLTAENHSTIGGLGAAMAECLAMGSARARFGMIGVHDTFAEGGSTAYLMAKYGLDAAHLAAKAVELFNTA